jgi:NitT/TauT family transport system substrate-binding protein
LNALGPACAALALALAAFAPLPVRAADRPSVSVAVTRSADAVPFFYALERGMFEKAGLGVEYQAMANGGAISAAVAGGAVNVGFSNVQTLIAAHAKHIPFTIIAPGGEYDDGNPTTALLVAGDSSLKSAKDLEGKTVAVGALQDLQALSVSAWMSANGGDPGKVRFIESPQSAAPAMLREKRADAIVVSEPNLEYAQSNGARVLAKPYGAIAPHLLVSGWYGTQAWAKANPDAVARFADVMRRASAYVNAHPDEMEPVIHAYTSIPLDTLHKMLRAKQGTTLAPADLQTVIDAAARFKVIDKPFPARDIIAASA